MELRSIVQPELLLQPVRKERLFKKKKEKNSGVLNEYARFSTTAVPIDLLEETLPLTTTLSKKRILIYVLPE